MSMAIPDFSQLQVIVVGDLMLDQYWFGPASRISPEAPVPVVRVTRSEARAGGAANVAMNLVSLGIKTTCCGVVGDDDTGADLKGLLEVEGISAALAKSERHPTITKLRVLSQNQQLIRLDTEQLYSAADAAAVVDVASGQLSANNVCILSDYAKGSLGEVAKIIAACHANNIPVLVDPKGTDFERYRGATVMTPNRAEFEAVVGASTDDEDLIARARTLCTELELDAIVVTLSEKGMLVVSAEAEIILPARARQVFDVTGAGDTVIAVLGLGIAAGLSFKTAVSLANTAAGIVVGKVGTATVSPQELLQTINGIAGEAVSKRKTLKELSELCRKLQKDRKRIVLTNGCFDLLHVGHIKLFSASKNLGDVLIVAIDDDDSVRRLKGPDRPVISATERVRILSALDSVDYMVVFATRDLDKVIAGIRPDVLTKGSNYESEEVMGRDLVESYGGRVELIPITEKTSSTQIINTIKKKIRSGLD